MPEDTLENPKPTDSQTGEAKLVPVAEAIRYRRRAQQAESELQQLRQEVETLRSQTGTHSEALAMAEAQRDEAQAHLTTLENRLAAERMLHQAGVVDPEAAWLLLSQEWDCSEAIDPQKLGAKVERLLLDKPYLHKSSDASLPPKTASPRTSPEGPTSQLIRAAEHAARSGDRRDVAEYLRLRRQASVMG
jgi:hypothetical protein